MKSLSHSGPITISATELRSLHSKRRVFTIILLLGFFILTVRGGHDPDLWWHLRAGQYMAQSHSVLHRDVFSYTKFGQTWIAHEWLSEVIMYLVYKWTSWAGLNLLFGLATGGAFAITFFRCAGRPYVAAPIVLLGMMASSPAWGLRPQMFSVLLTAIFLLLLDRAENNSGLSGGIDSPARYRFLWLMAPLTVLWVNLHAGYAIGLVLIGVTLAGWLLEVGLGLRAWEGVKAPAETLALVFVICLALVPLNPNGLRLYIYPLETLRAHGIQDFIQEWASPNFHEVEFKPLLALFLLSFLALALAGRRVRAAQLLILVGTAYGTLTAVRHVPVFAIVAVPIVCACLVGWMNDQGWKWFKAADQSAAAGKLALNVVLLLAMVGFTLFRFNYIVREQPSLEARYFPVGATAFLAQNQPPPNLFNYYDWGGYFIWKLYPKYRVFSDGRTDLYGDELMEAFSHIANADDHTWRQRLEMFGVATVVVPPQSGLSRILQYDSGWKKLYENKQAVIFSREHTGNR